MRMWEGYDLDEGYVWAKKVPKKITSWWLVDKSFIWSRAPFGHDYWLAVYDDIRNGKPLSPYNRDLINAIVTGKP